MDQDTQIEELKDICNTLEATAGLMNVGKALLTAKLIQPLDRVEIQYHIISALLIARKAIRPTLPVHLVNISSLSEEDDEELTLTLKTIKSELRRSERI